MIRRLLVVVLVAVLGAGAAWLTRPAPEAAAVGAGDALGEYVLKLKGSGFDRNASSGRVSQGRLRGRAVLSVTRTSDAGDPRDLTVRVSLENALDGSLLDRATPTPALQGRGVLVGDSLTVIGAGQTNFVNALTLRFVKNGKRVEGWWLASFPGDDAASGFVAGVGMSLKGKRLRQGKAVPATALSVR